MRPSRTPAARGARATFRQADRRIRLHALLRPWTAPFDELEELVPIEGRVLDFGCGSGLFTIQLALASPDRRLHGVDLSAYKVEQGRRAAAGLADRIELEVVDPGWEPRPASYDAVVMCDVLYLLGPASIERIVTSALRSLRPGGVLVIKEIRRAPRWKHRVAALQETLSVRVLRWTSGSVLNLDPLQAVEAAVPSPVWSRREVALDRGYPYSHVAMIVSRGRA